MTENGWLDVRQGVPRSVPLAFNVQHLGNVSIGRNVDEAFHILAAPP